MAAGASVSCPREEVVLFSTDGGSKGQEDKKDEARLLEMLSCYEELCCSQRQRIAELNSEVEGYYNSNLSNSPNVNSQKNSVQKYSSSDISCKGIYGINTSWKSIFNKNGEKLSESELLFRWKNNILPMWSSMVNSRLFNRLLLIGIPHTVRGDVWMKMVPDSLGFSKEFFNIICRSVEKCHRYSLKHSVRYASRILGETSTLLSNVEDEKEGGNSHTTDSSSECCWEPEVLAAFEALSVDLHRTLPRFGVINDCQTDMNDSNNNNNNNNVTPKNIGPRFKLRKDLSTSGPSIFGPPATNDLVLQQSSDESCPIVKEPCLGHNDKNDDDNDVITDDEPQTISSDISNIHQNDEEGTKIPQGSFLKRKEQSFVEDVSLVNDTNPNQLKDKVSIELPSYQILYDRLRIVLEAFAITRPDVGYVQGMAHIAGLLVIYLDDYNSFILLSNLLLRKSLRAFYTFDMETVHIYFRTFDVILKTKLPDVANKLQQVGINSDVFLIEWLYTLFTRALPFELLVRIWDFILIHGEPVLFQTSVGILAYFQRYLLSATLPECINLLSSSSTHQFKEIDVDSFLKIVQGLGISPQYVATVMKKVTHLPKKPSKRINALATAAFAVVNPYHKYNGS